MNSDTSLINSEFLKKEQIDEATSSNYITEFKIKEVESLNESHSSNILHEKTFFYNEKDKEFFMRRNIIPTTFFKKFRFEIFSLYFLILLFFFSIYINNLYLYLIVLFFFFLNLIHLSDILFSKG